LTKIIKLLQYDFVLIKYWNKLMIFLSWCVVTFSVRTS
jgi:hypothetical protein